MRSQFVVRGALDNVALVIAMNLEICFIAIFVIAFRAIAGLIISFKLTTLCRARNFSGRDTTTWRYTLNLPNPTAMSPDVLLVFKTGLRVTHFVALVVGLGAATLLDLIILRFLATKKVTRDHYHTVEFASRIVAVGLALLWASGVGFLVYYGMFDPEKLGNQKIWAKITIVGILTLNGVFIHRSVLPIIQRNVGRFLFEGLTQKQRGLLLATGVVSATSWYVPLLLGSIPQLNFVVPAWIIFAVYATLLSVGIVMTQGIARFIIPQIGMNGAAVVSSRRKKFGITQSDGAAATA